MCDTGDHSDAEIVRGEGGVSDGQSEGAERHTGQSEAASVRVVMEEIGVQTGQMEEESRNEERKEEDRNELAKLRVSLIEAKVGWFHIYQS